ncbi:MAG: repeat containing protein, partial [Nevskia sp.]|nr:repeat containing protein [Nevskia sp.]
VAGIYGLPQGANAPFLDPTPLTQAPNDWTMLVTVIGGGLSQSNGLAIDGDGSIWVTNPISDAGINAGKGSISAFLNNGVQVTGAPFVVTGLGAPLALNIGADNHVWVLDSTSNHNRGSLYELSGSGSLLATHTTGFNGASLMSFGPAGTTLWVVNGNRALARLNSGNSYAISASNSTVLPGSESPAGLTIDGKDQAWTVLYFANEVVALDDTGTQLSGSPFSGSVFRPISLAVSSGDNVWIADQQGNQVTELGADGTPSPGSPFGAASFNGFATDSLAIDGGGRVWVVNGDGSVGVLNGDGTAASAVAYGAGQNMGQPAGVAIDSSGSVWEVSNSGTGTLSKFIGLAAPVKTPLLGPATLP